MSEQITFLLATAATICFLHTILVPDHYNPFIAISKTRKWTKSKTFWVTLVYGIGQVLSSVVIGAVGIALGVALNKLEYIESFRGDIAGWLLIGFGLAYFIWGIKKALRGKSHCHIHMHDDGTLHTHTHNHNDSHIHVHTNEGKEYIPLGYFLQFSFSDLVKL